MRQQSKMIWVTGAALLLAGCAGAGGGDEKNYKVNDEPVRTDHDSGSMVPTDSVLKLATVDEPPIGLTASDASVSGSSPATAPPTSPSAAKASPTGAVSDSAAHHSAMTLAPDTQPSVIGFDRSSWPKVVVGPDSGSVGHYPTYFKDPKPEFVRHREKLPTTESDRLNWPLRDERAESFAGKNKWTEFFLQPGKAFLDLVESPYHVYQAVPWTDVNTPEHPTCAQVVPNRPPHSEAEINALLKAPSASPVKPNVEAGRPDSTPVIQAPPYTPVPAPAAPASTGDASSPTRSSIENPSSQPAAAPATQPEKAPEYVDPNSLNALDLPTDTNTPPTTAPASRKPHVSPVMKWLSGE